MMAAHPFRWFLGLLAMLAPVAATSGRAGDTARETAIQRPGDDHVVFRHYL